MVEKHKLIIIGAGPAGLTAALYAARAELKPLVIEGYKAGGQLMLTTDVENFPGFEKAIKGPDLIAVMRKQAESFGTKYISENVTEVDFSKRPFKVKTAELEFEAESVIISTGADAKWLGLESEQKLLGRGVTSCATCDGAFFKDQEVVVIGGGDSAMEEALFLTKFANKVTVVHRRDELRASKIMQQRALKHEKIEFLFDSVVVEVLDVEAKKVTGAKIKNVKTNEEKIVPCSGFFLAIGHKPNTELFKDTGLEIDDKGYLVTKGKSSKTNIEGVFACGDVQDFTYMQAVTAAGSGCVAALDCERFLSEHE